MDKNVYFREWIHNWNWGMRTALFLILMFSILQFSLFSLTQNYVISYFGAQSEDVTFSIQVTYISLLFTLPIQVRFLNYFNTRKYLIVSLLFGIIINLLLMGAKDIQTFIILRFLLGMAISLIAGAMLTLIFSRLHDDKKQAVGYSVFYGTLLGSSVFAGVPSAWVIDNMDWKMIYYIAILSQVVSIIIVFIIILPEPKHKKIPLYQIDWKAYVPLAAGMVSVAFVMVYGAKNYWFEDRSIVYALLFAILSLVLFTIRQINSKRPIIHFSIFKSPKFITGLFLLAFFYGFKDTINLVYSYINTTAQWSAYDYMKLAACNVSGMAIAMYTASQLIQNKRFGIRFFLITGFGSMLAFNYWMYLIISPDLSFTDLMLPIFLQGLSLGLLFVPIATFILSTVPIHTGISGSLVAGNVRFFTTLNSFTGYYTLQLFYNQHYKEQFLNHLTPDDTAYTERLSILTQSYISKGYSAAESAVLSQGSIMQSVKTQSQLLTNQSIFLLVAGLLGVLIAVVVVFPFFRRKVAEFDIN